MLTSFLKQRLADRIIVCVAPIIIGNGTSAFGDLGVEKVDRAVVLANTEWSRSGPDTILSARPVWR